MSREEPFSMTEEERLILGAGRTDGPSEVEFRRAARALGIAGVGLTMAAGTKLAADVGAAGLEASGGLKWWLLGLGAGGGTLAAAMFLTPTPQQPMPPVAIVVPEQRAAVEAEAPPEAPKPAVVEQAADVEQEVVEQQDLEQEQEPAAPTVVRRQATPVREKPKKTDELGKEIALLDSVRSALSGGNGAKALAVLADYDKNHPRGLMRQEATLLRLEALSKAGRTSEARALARRMLQAQPQSPHRKRIESLVGPL